MSKESLEKLRKPVLEWMEATDEKGQDLVEYALIISLIALVLVGVVSLFGESVKNLFEAAILFVNEWIITVEASTAQLQALQTQMAIPTPTGVLP